MQNEMEKIISGALFTDDKMVDEIHPSITIGGKIVGTPGNFICISGLPKSRKTAFSFGAVASLILKKSVYDIQLHNPENKSCVIIDTESSRYSFTKNIKSLYKKLGVQKMPKNLYCYLMRKYDPSITIKMIEKTIEIHNPSFMVIDNLTELVNLNDPDESKKLVEFLKKITEEKNITMICIIHLSKSNNFTIGWLGSYTDRASQSTIRVVKDAETDISTMEAVLMRDDSHFNPVSITWDSYIDDYSLTSSTPTKAPGKLDIFKASRQECINFAQIITNGQSSINYDDLVNVIKQTLNVGINKSKSVIPFLLNQGYILKSKDGYKLNTLNQ
jgi:hypothetical protein